MLLVISTATILFLTGAKAARAQDQPPDIQMLLNLDLFGSRSPAQSSDQSDSGQSASMLDQIRTLDAMGYLGPAGQHPSPASGAMPDNTPDADRSSDYGSPEL